MTKPYIKLDNFAVEAELYGIFRLVPKKDKCNHVTCGYHAYDYWDITGKMVKASKTPVKCSYERYIKCTNQELADPDQKVGTIFAAIRVVVASVNNYDEWDNSSMIFLYDVVGESVKDSWFQRGGNESIAPHSGVGQNWPKPSTLKNLHDVIEGMKKEI